MKTGDIYFFAMFTHKLEQEFKKVGLLKGKNKEVEANAPTSMILHNTLSCNPIPSGCQEKVQRTGVTAPVT